MLFYFTLFIGIAVPLLLILAYVDKTKHVNHKLPPWRRFLGIMSLVSLVVSWACFLIPAVMLGVFKVRSFSEAWPAAQLFLALSGISFAFALEGKSRVQSLGAGLCLIVLLFSMLNV